ncbi:MAG: Eco57I restriction-modification methylase domain-containing protein, partial [Patescibacteria group bacterium]|nr:Eco57I restriction-modification methylase domain-containing protein [Patescibacteria group bacterium]
NHIIENSIYGVDLNDESVEITKLSLFLKLAGPDRKLIGLSNNIKSGNSIIDNNQVHGKAFSFHEKFPEVMDKRFGGFDIIIGNPPYIPIELMSEQEKDYYKKTFDGIYRKYDSSVLFVERVIGLLKENGRIGFIMPVTWQTGDNYPQFRRMLFEKMKMTLANIVNLPFDVFPDAYVDTGIMILNKNQSVSFYAYQYDKNEKIHSIDITLGNRINFNRILNHPDFKVFTSDDVYSKNAFNEKEFVPLGKITDSTQGIVTSKYPITNIKKSDECAPFLLSADSNRYRFQPKETAYIDSTKIPNIAHLYINPKIMIRRIVNRQNRLMAFYEDTGIVTNKDYNPFIIITPDFDMFYILGLLNSRLFSYYYFKSSTLAQKDDFRQTTLSELRKLSIKIVEKDTQKLIAEKAEKMTQITKQYFDLKDKVLRRIVDNFNIKPSKKITNLTDMSFHEFKDEIERIDKRKIRLEEQDEWEKYFTRNINVLKDLKNQITLLDYEIDENVFDLYDITTDERIAIKKEILEPVL